MNISLALLPQNALILPTRKTDPDLLTFIEIRKYKVQIPSDLTFAERVQLGKFGGISRDVNERNFPINDISDCGFLCEVVLAGINPFAITPKLTNESIRAGICNTHFQAATGAVHLEVSHQYDGLETDQPIISMGAVAPNWRGPDSQRSVLGTVRYSEVLNLTNYLLHPTRTWNDKSLFLLYRPV